LFWKAISRMAALFCVCRAKNMEAIETKTKELLTQVTSLQGVGRMISRKNLKTLCDAHIILGDLIKAAQSMESSRVIFDGEQILFTGGDE